MRQAGYLEGRQAVGWHLAGPPRAGGVPRRRDGTHIALPSGAMAIARSIPANHKPWIGGIYLLLQTLDVATTMVALRLGATEGNPVARYILETYGEPVLLVWKAAVVVGVLLVVLALQRRYAGLWFALRVVNVFMAVVVMLNSVVILSLAG